MTIEGELVVRLDWTGGRVRDVAIRSSRPLAVPAVLAGRGVAEAAAIVPRLYSVCANAQGGAAAAALACAAGADPGNAMRAAAPAIVREAIGEQLRRLLIDLPVLRELAAAAEPVKAARSALARPAGPRDDETSASTANALRGVATLHVLGMDPADWLALDAADDVRAWASAGRTLPARVVAKVLDDDARLGACDVAPMPRPDRAAIEGAVLASLATDPSFAAQPLWHGEPVATGAWARLHDHPLVAACTREWGNGVVTLTIARLTAVAADIAALAAERPTGDTIDAWSPAPGEGACRVETARGMLVHAARVADGRVAGYAIVAPTEWNFHPRGPLAHALAGLADADGGSLRRRASEVVQALDPCVACRVEVGHA